MSEWQPAKIAPFNAAHEDIPYPDDWIAQVGKVLRVRVVEGPSRVDSCALKIQVHPDDAPLIGCPSDLVERCFLCEHMILTD